MTGFAAGAAPPVTIDIVAGSTGLDGIAAAINAKNAGVTASVVTDADGSAYLSLKGASGAAQAFTLQATDDPSGNLAQLNVGVGATGTALTAAAQNARLTVDGVTVERASNTISDLIDGVKLQLTGVSNTAVALTSTTPTDALKSSITDFVDTYNGVLKTLNDQLNPQTGPLRGDTAAQSLLRSLQSLTTKSILSNVAAGTPTTLGEIGIKTNRDGTLAVDDATVAHALANSPDAVEAMFSFSSHQRRRADRGAQFGVAEREQHDLRAWCVGQALRRPRLRGDESAERHLDPVGRDDHAADPAIRQHECQGRCLQIHPGIPEESDRRLEQAQLMPAYATALGADPYTTYRQIDLAGRTAEADGGALVQLLYDELVRALRVAAWATEKRNYSLKSEKVTRATAILFALEAGLDFEVGGDVSHTLARLYSGARATIVDASIGQDPRPFRDVASNLEEIAVAWAQVRGSA